MYSIRLVLWKIIKLKDVGIHVWEMCQWCKFIYMHKVKMKKTRKFIHNYNYNNKSKTSINEHNNNEIWCVVFTCCSTMLALDVVVN